MNFLRSRKWLLWVFASLSGLARCHAQEVAVETLHSIESIRTQPAELIEKGLPVEIAGIVSCRTTKGLYINGGGRCIFIDWEQAESKGVWQGHRPADENMQVGDSAQIRGITAPGNYSPKVLPRIYRKTRAASLPEPRVIQLDRLLSGNADGQWVSLDGVIQEAVMTDNGKEAVLLLLTSGHTCRISMWDASTIDLAQIIDARVSVRGVFSPLVNLRKEMSGLGLFCTDARDIRIAKPAPADPFGSPRVGLKNLLAFAPKDFYPWHRRVTRGIVSFTQPGQFFFMQDGGTGIRVECDDRTLKAGDELEVSGFVTTTATLAGMNGAVVRRLSSAPVPLAEEVTTNQLLRPTLRNPWTGEAFEDFHGRRIALTGTLMRADRDAEGGLLVLMMESDGFSFPVKIPLESKTPTVPWTIGSRLKLSGTCELYFNERPVIRRAIPVTGFAVWTSSPEDLVLLAKPSWWTPGRMWLAIAAAAILLGVSLVWVRMLHREVMIRGNRLASEITRRNEAGLRFEAALRERNLLAADLHDTLEQSLVGLSLQLQAANLFFETDPPKSRHHLDLAETFLDRSRDEMRRTVTNLRDTGMSERNLFQSLRESADLISNGGVIRIEVRLEGEERPLPDFITGNLLMLAQEAITNAFKHAKPSHIDVSVAYRENDLALIVSDDGVGFDTNSAAGPGAGHYGLQGMRERAKRLGAELTITSSPGMGTSIEVRLRHSANPR